MGNNYAPKFCRTRRCTLRFGHEEACDVTQGVILPWPARTPPAHGASVQQRPQRSPRMRHGIDQQPRRSAVLRAINREMRRRAAERPS